MLVIDNEVKEDPHNIIPISNTHSKSTLVLLLAESDIPPVLLIDKSDGDLIYKTLKTMQSSHNPSKNRLRIHVNFDLKKYQKLPLDLRIWFNPVQEESYKFLIDFVYFYEHISNLVNLDLVYRLKTSEQYNYPNEHSDPNCIANGKYCIVKEAGMYHFCWLTSKIKKSSPQKI